MTTIDENILLLKHYGKGVIGPNMIASIIASIETLDAEVNRQIDFYLGMGE